MAVEIDLEALADYSSLVKEYGPELIGKLLAAVRKRDRRITKADIDELKKQLRKPEEY